MVWHCRYGITCICGRTPGTTALKYKEPKEFANKFFDISNEMTFCKKCARKIKDFSHADDLQKKHDLFKASGRPVEALEKKEAERYFVEKRSALLPLKQASKSIKDIVIYVGQLRRRNFDPERDHLFHLACSKDEYDGLLDSIKELLPGGIVTEGQEYFTIGGALIRCWPDLPKNTILHMNYLKRC